MNSLYEKGYLAIEKDSDHMMMMMITFWHDNYHVWPLLVIIIIYNVTDDNISTITVNQPNPFTKEKKMNEFMKSQRKKNRFSIFQVQWLFFLVQVYNIIQEFSDEEEEWKKKNSFTRWKFHQTHTVCFCKKFWNNLFKKNSIVYKVVYRKNWHLYLIFV